LTDTVTNIPGTPPTLRLMAGRHKRVKAGHPWVYSNEIVMDAASKKLAPGTIVRLEADSGEPLGLAMFNPRTLIAARVMDRDPGAVIDRDFLIKKIAAALMLRERIYPGGYYRLIHAEADGLPGMIIDRYGDLCVVQANTAGMDRLLPDLIEALEAVLEPATIVLRNDAGARQLEGLSDDVRLVKGSLDGLTDVYEYGAPYYADLRGGQKTGWFYDQRDNRALVARMASGARVLDGYAYIGGFGISCARAGAREVTILDRSALALDLATHSARRNGVDGVCRYTKAEVYPELERLAAAGERFDIVIVDPPAFVKSKKDLQAGVRGYRKLARLAAALVIPRGLLFIASCSHNVDRPTFNEQVARGIEDADRPARILFEGGAGLDHPVHPALPETAYLKASMLQLD
jgi:23S rRNA (cytosine1962-C5)-methyltransferase